MLSGKSLSDSLLAAQWVTMIIKQRTGSRNSETGSDPFYDNYACFETTALSFSQRVSSFSNISLVRPL